MSPPDTIKKAILDPTHTADERYSKHLILAKWYVVNFQLTTFVAGSVYASIGYGGWSDYVVSEMVGRERINETYI